MNYVIFEDLFSIPLRNGVSYPALQRGSGYPMINMGEAFRFDRISNQECERVPLTKTERDRYMLQAGDILFVRQSLKYEGAGRCVYVEVGEEPRTWESHLIRVRLSPTLADSRYYFYYFRSPVGRLAIESIIEQVAAAGIRGSDLRRLKVPYPPVPVQASIADILSVLDDKIAANDRIIGVQEQILTARFDELCIDVDYSHEPEVPATELVEFNPRTTAVRSSDAVYLDMSAVPTSSARIRQWCRREPKSGARFMNYDTVMARITPCLENGKVGFIDFMGEGEVGVGSTEFIVMRARPGIPVHLPYFLARSSRFQNHAIRNMVGSSGRQRVSAAQLAGFPLRRPDCNRLATFREAASVAFSHMKSLGAESRTLTELRDSLLPKLMSGEIRVRDTERIVEDAT